MKKALIALNNFLFSNGITITKTKSGKGFMIYEPSQVTDIAKLKSLAKSVKWKVIESQEEWDKGHCVSSAHIFVGPVKSSFDITDKKASLDYLESQLI
tara:strand:+ start:276 stop:569 length:294 start_codon:yes stop_codon:yes gene_type:complete